MYHTNALAIPEVLLRRRWGRSQRSARSPSWISGTGKGTGEGWEEGRGKGKGLGSGTEKEAGELIYSLAYRN